VPIGIVRAVRVAVMAGSALYVLSGPAIAPVLAAQAVRLSSPCGSGSAQTISASLLTKESPLQGASPSESASPSQSYEPVTFAFFKPVTLALDKPLAEGRSALHHRATRAA
jgi:hypothetical protein